MLVIPGGVSLPGLHGRPLGQGTETTLEVLAGHGVDVLLDAADGYTPTPVISHQILAHNRDAARARADGIVLTPSHNPPEDGGFKYNPPHGGPAETEVTNCIEDQANDLLEVGPDAACRSNGPSGPSHPIATITSPRTSRACPRSST